MGKALTIAGAALLMSSLLAPDTFAEDATEKSYGGAGVPTLKLNVPAGWADHSIKPPPGRNLPPVVQFEHKEASGAFNVKITLITGGRTKTMTDIDVKKAATGIGQQYAGNSVEKKVDLKPIKGDQLAGYTATYTDASPNAGEFPCVTTVTAKLGDGLLAATILHQKESVDLPAALEMLKNATVGDGKAAATQPAGVRVTSPDRKWAIVFDLPGAQPADTDTSPDHKVSQLATQTDSGMNCSAFIEPAANAGNAMAVRTFYWNKEKLAPLDYTDIKMSGDAKLAILTFTTAGQFLNAHGYMVANGKWVDIHLSQPKGAAGGLEAMVKAIRSAHIEPVK